MYRCLVVMCRWNSFYDCAHRLVEQREALKAAFSHDERLAPSQRKLPHDKRLSDDEWKLLSDLVSVLYPFRKVSHGA